MKKYNIKRYGLEYRSNRRLAIIKKRTYEMKNIFEEITRM
jgi:hypothetical protein